MRCCAGFLDVRYILQLMVNCLVSSLFCQFILLLVKFYWLSFLDTSSIVNTGCLGPGSYPNCSGYSAVETLLVLNICELCRTRQKILLSLYVVMFFATSAYWSNSLVTTAYAQCLIAESD